MERILFQKAALLKEKTVEGTHEINKKYFIDKLLLPAMCLWRIQTLIPQHYYKIFFLST